VEVPKFFKGEKNPFSQRETQNPKTHGTGPCVKVNRPSEMGERSHWVDPEVTQREPTLGRNKGNIETELPTIQDGPGTLNLLGGTL